MEQEKTAADVAALLFAVLSAFAASGLLRLVFAWCRKLLEAKNRTRLILKLENIKRSRQVMSQIASLPYVTRAMMFNGHDSGSTPDIGRPFYITEVDGYPSSEAGVDDEYYEVHVDDGYIQMLLDTIKTGSYNFITDAEPPSLLKSIYQKQGVVHSKLFYIGSYSDRLVYMSVASHNEVFTEDQRIEIRLLVDKLTAYFRSR